MHREIKQVHTYAPSFSLILLPYQCNGKGMEMLPAAAAVIVGVTTTTIATRSHPLLFLLKHLLHKTEPLWLHFRCISILMYIFELIRHVLSEDNNG
jgi:hypothetical protein